MVTAMVATVRVRRAEVRDLPAVTRPWRELVRFHEAFEGPLYRLRPGAQRGWEAFMRGRLTDVDKLCLVAEPRGRPVGFLAASLEQRPPCFLYRDYGDISDLYVDDAHRSHGVGKALVDEAVRWFREKGVRRIRLQTDARNGRGIAFWRTVGFHPAMLTMDRID